LTTEAQSECGRNEKSDQSEPGKAEIAVADQLDKHPIRARCDKRPARQPETCFWTFFHSLGKKSADKRVETFRFRGDIPDYLDKRVTVRFPAQATVLSVITKITARFVVNAPLPVFNQSAGDGRKSADGLSVQSFGFAVCLTVSRQSPIGTPSKTGFGTGNSWKFLFIRRFRIVADNRLLARCRQATFCPVAPSPPSRI